jgi:hypothetical protein
MSLWRCLACAGAFALGVGVRPATASESVYLTGVPDYLWHAGCFGTATGNLIGYWDRHGFPNFYTGPTAGGVAPLDSYGLNFEIRALWASEAGVDGRPEDQPGHMDDYWIAYESVGDDPYRAAGRAEHEWDCIGDYIGLNQRKWQNLGGECDGNIDGYAFNFFDRDGGRRVNYTPVDDEGNWIPDIQSGLRAWTESRGAQADTFSQLADFNPDLPAGAVGFTFEDLRAEIDAGYPVLLYMQPVGVFSRTHRGMPNQNPPIHAMLAYGYHIDDSGTRRVRYRTSWADGDLQFSVWAAGNWFPEQLNMPLRGVIGYRPKPQLLRAERRDGRIHLEWQGPLSFLYDDAVKGERPVHAYIIEKTESLAGGVWEQVAGPVYGLQKDIPEDCCGGTAFFRVQLITPPPL